MCANSAVAHWALEAELVSETSQAEDVQLDVSRSTSKSGARYEVLMHWPGIHKLCFTCAVKPEKLGDVLVP